MKVARALVAAAVLLVALGACESGTPALSPSPSLTSSPSPTMPSAPPSLMPSTRPESVTCAEYLAGDGEAAQRQAYFTYLTLVDYDQPDVEMDELLRRLAFVATAYCVLDESRTLEAVLRQSIDEGLLDMDRS
jgi:ABC-type transport system substrate-binding protein